MKRFYEKPKSDSGASIVFALLVFLLCVLAGTVALTAASANAGRYTHLEEEQRQYFSVASALALLQGQLDDRDSVEVTVKRVETEKWSYIEDTTGTPLPGEEPTYVLHKEPVVTEIDLGSLDTISTGYYEYLLLKNCLPPEWWEWIEDHWPVKWGASPPTGVSETYTITPPTEYTDFLYPVTVMVKNGSDASGTGSYNLEMTLETETGGAYPLKVVWVGEVETKTETTVETTGDVFTSPLAGDPDSKGTRTTTTTITCTLTWSKEDRTVTFE